MSIKSINKSLLIAILFAVSLTAFAQDTAIDSPLVTDRPDATEASSTVGKGVFQIETGGFYESYKDGNETFELNTYNTTLLRYGILDNLEIRVGWNFTEGVTTLGDHRFDDVTSGFTPMLIGVKLDITEEKGTLPEIALLLHTNHPFFASKDNKTISTGADFRFSLSHTLSENSSLGYNLGMSWNGDTTRASYLYTIAYGYALTGKFGTYLELYGDLPEGLNFTHYWDAGFTYLVSNDIQLDAYVGSSITEGQDLLLGLGASFRIPSKK